MTSVAVSPSRLIRTWSPWVSTTEASVTCGSPRRSASIAGTTLIAPSVEAMPHDDQVALGADLLDRLGQHQRGGERVGAGDRVVDDVDALVGAHLQRLAHRVDGLLGADAQRGDGDVVAVALLLDLQRLLDGVLVELRQQPVDTDAVDGVVGLELAVGQWRRARTSHRRQCSWQVWPAGPSCANRCRPEATGAVDGPAHARPERCATGWATVHRCIGPHGSAPDERRLARAVLDERRSCRSHGPRWRTARRTAGARSPGRSRGRPRGRGRSHSLAARSA